MILFRNFISIVRHYWTAFLLNTIGLGVALSVTALVIMQLRYDFSFDSSQPERDRITMFTVSYSDFGRIGLAPRPLQRTLEGCPGVASVCLTEPIASYVSIKYEETGHLFKEKAVRVSEEFTDVFHFDFTERSQELLDVEGAVIIPESMAMRLGGGRSMLGENVSLLSAGSPGIYTVTGIYRDFAPNSSISNAIYFPLDPHRDYNAWTSYNYNMFLLLEDNADRDAIGSMLRNEMDAREGMEGVIGDVELLPLEKMHFRNDVIFDNFPKADFQRLMIFLTIAVLVLAVAGINMANLNTAIAPVRVRSINTMKILGSPRAELCVGIMMESVITAIAAWGLSLVLVYALKGTPVAGLIDPEISLVGQYPAFLVTSALAVLSGALSGLYPGIYITSFPTALALKGNFALSPKGRKVRSILIGFQFAVSFILMSCTGVILLQDRHMMETDLGFENGRIMTVRLDGQLAPGQKDVFRTEVGKLPGVERSAFANILISSGDNIPTWGREIDGKQLNFNVIAVSEGFMETIGATITEGRDFREGDECKWIFNENARRSFNLTSDSRVNGSEEITGFVGDIHTATLRQPVAPTGFLFDPGSSFHDDVNDVAYIRIAGNSDMYRVGNMVLDILDDLVPDYPFEIRTGQDTFRETYAEERDSTLLISLFGAVAIIISLVGVSGLVMFDGESRRKEIAVRKVIGAGIPDIIMRFNLSYMLILAVCFAVSIPAAAYFSSRWLSQFSERIGMPWWIFIPVTLALAGITAMTVTGVCRRIAYSDPVDNLKSE